MNGFAFERLQLPSTNDLTKYKLEQWNPIVNTRFGNDHFSRFKGCFETERLATASTSTCWDSIGSQVFYGETDYWDVCPFHAYALLYARLGQVTGGLYPLLQHKQSSRSSLQVVWTLCISLAAQTNRWSVSLCSSCSTVARLYSHIWGCRTWTSVWNR